MEWHQLKYFQTLAHLQHYTKAAEKALISQPALSRSIPRLELELGVPIFERKGRNIELTKYGEVFRNRVENAIGEIELGKQEIQNLTNPEYGSLSVAFIHSEFVVDLIHSFQTHHPNMRYALSQTGSNVIINRVKSGEVDIGFVSFLPSYEEVLKVEPIYQEELFLVVPFHHKLAKFNQIDLKSVKNEPFVAYKKGYGLRMLMDEFCGKVGLSPQIIFEGEEVSSILECVSANLGITISSDFNSLDKSKFKLIKIIHPHCVRSIALVWRDKSYLSPPAKKFISYIQDLYRPK